MEIIIKKIGINLLIGFLLMTSIVNAAITDVEVTTDFNLSYSNNSLRLDFEKDSFTFDLGTNSIAETKSIKFIRELSSEEVEKRLEACVVNYGQEFAECTKKKELVQENLKLCDEKTQACLARGSNPDAEECAQTLGNYKTAYEDLVISCQNQTAYAVNTSNASYPLDWTTVLVSAGFGALLYHLIKKDSYLKSTPDEVTYGQTDVDRENPEEPQ